MIHFQAAQTAISTRAGLVGCENTWFTVRRQMVLENFLYQIIDFDLLQSIFYAVSIKYTDFPLEYFMKH